MQKPSRKRRIGILGGSFNPAHAGHLHISRAALRMLRLDEVWWMVSPQNPLKRTEGMAGLERRIDAARKVAARDRRIRVTDIEVQLGTRYTADTLDALIARNGNARYVWLMGADNLLQISRWARWARIFNTVPIAVFARPTYSSRAVFGTAARRFARARWPQAAAKRLADAVPPAWVFLRMREHPESASSIRARGGF